MFWFLDQYFKLVDIFYHRFPIKKLVEMWCITWFWLEWLSWDVVPPWAILVFPVARELEGNVETSKRPCPFLVILWEVWFVCSFMFRIFKIHSQIWKHLLLRQIIKISILHLCIYLCLLPVCLTKYFFSKKYYTSISVVQEWSSGEVLGMYQIFWDVPTLHVTATSEHWAALVSRDHHDWPAPWAFLRNGPSVRWAPPPSSSSEN